MAKDEKKLGRPKASKPLGVQTGIRLDETIKARLDDVCAKLDRPASWVMRKALEEYLDRQEGKKGD